MMLLFRQGFGTIRPAAWASSFTRNHLAAALAVMMLIFPSPAFSQATTPPTSTPPTAVAPCSSSEFRAFDFWIGEWEVTAAGNTSPTATSRITARHGGCVVLEQYRTGGGYTGMSLSFYDAPRKVWHQTWMGADGTPLHIEGGLNAAGEMVLSNANWPGYVPGSPINRVTWSPNEDGSVRQNWETSSDGGKTWSDVFDGRYVPRKPE